MKYTLQNLLAELEQQLIEDNDSDRLKQFLTDKITKLVTEAVTITGETSDGYHTFNELYDFRKVFNAALFNEWATQEKYSVHKSKKHSDGEDCFGGGWFIVMATLPTGQISKHYDMKDWDLFQCQTRERADKWDGHTATDVLDRLRQQILSVVSTPIKPKGKQTMTLMTDTLISKCCKKLLEVVNGDEGTSYWRCIGCGEASDPYVEQEKPPTMTDKPQKLEEIVWKEISDEVHTICQHIGDYTYSSAEETLGTLIEKVIEKTADEVRREVKTAYGQPLSTFIQWKGTDLCMDWFCEVGHQNHWDGDFAYKISCDSCLREYYPESWVRLSLTEPLFT